MKRLLTKTKIPVLLVVMIAYLVGITLIPSVVHAIPAVTVTSPTPGQSVGAGDLQVTGTAPALSEVSVKLDGVSKGVATASGAGNWDLTLHNVTAGSHSVTAQQQTQDHYAFLANRQSGSIDVVDVETHSYVHEITDEHSVGVIYNSKNDRLYSAATWNNSCAMRVINPKNYAIVQAIGMGDGDSPISIALDPSGSKAYEVCSDNEGGYYVMVVDTATNLPVANFNLEPSSGGISGIAINPANTKIWLRTYEGIEIYNVSDYSHDDSFMLSFGGSAQQNIVFNEDGSKAYTGENVDGLIHVIDTSDNSLLTNIVVDPGISNIAFTPDFSKLYAIASFASTITVVDPSDGSVIDNQPTNYPPESLAITDDGANFVVGDDHGTGGIFFGAVFGNALVNNTIFAPNGGSFYTSTGNFITSSISADFGDPVTVSFQAVGAPDTGDGAPLSTQPSSLMKIVLPFGFIVFGLTLVAIGWRRRDHLSD